MDVKYLKQVLIGFLSVLLVILLFGYVVYHLTGGFSTEIKTAPALSGTYYDTTDGEGYIFRYEKPMREGKYGSVNYNVSDGEKAGKNILVATVYEGGNSELSSELVEIDEKIELLKNSNISDNVSISDTKATDDQISEYFRGIFSARREGNYALATNYKTDLLISLNRRELIVTSRTSYDEQISELTKKRNEIALGLGGENERVYMEESGYFYYKCDGYENIYDPALLEDLTPSGLEALSKEAPDTATYIGKNVLSEKWYLAIPFDRTEIKGYIQGDTYSVAFSDYGSLTLDMRLERINTDGAEALLVFSCSRMPEGFDYGRSVSVSIINESYSGLRFSLSAVRIYGGVEGVFVLYGNTVFFRSAKVIGTENGYAYVLQETEEATTNDGQTTISPLALYDEVIISGTGLYHGMIVN